ncbi:hypothetical protein [Azohydromonas caseinilytica]|uniref:Uncharacterized protein n=1 Tax=Azohydromonas caseinilytica TaxID=2728836 RepID=A0A848F5N9_9BURK|nr:hypothetical protein [Azohydromonas caseinilytica]NML13683.1 hypothetical protein [Azohydromonas caseinilytica]
MSTPADVVRDVIKLINSVTELLQTQTAREAPNVARDLGVLPQFNAGVAALAGAIRKIRTALVPVQRAVIDADALVAVIGFVPDLLTGLGDAVSSSGEWLASLELRLDGATDAARQAEGAIDTVSDAVAIGIDAGEAALELVAPAQWGGVVQGLDRLLAALADLKPTPPATPGTTPAPPALAGLTG